MPTVIQMPVWADAIAAVAAVLLALGTIWRYIVPAVRGMWQLVQGTAQLVEDYRASGGFAGLAAQNAHLTVEVAAVKRELHPNGGSSMRDSLTRTEKATAALTERVAEVDAKAIALGERQEVLRRADQQYAADLKAYISTHYTEAMQANAHLRAAVNELLLVDPKPDP